MRKICILALVAALAPLLAPPSAADDPLTAVLDRDGYTVSLNLKITRKNQGSLRRLYTLLAEDEPNAYASGFVVGDRLVMTSYHVVSGHLSADKKRILGFAPDEQLSVRAFVNDCEAQVLKVDEESDLALLRVCRTQKQAAAPAFQAEPQPEERLLVIARPNGDKYVRRGTFSGPYMLGSRLYWSAKIEGRDGYSGSPVYNNRGEIVGVFKGYDWARKIALISPGARAQKLLEDYASDAGR